MNNEGDHRGEDREFLIRNMPGLQLPGFIPFSEDIIEADLEGRPPFERYGRLDVVREMVSKMVMP